MQLFLLAVAFSLSFIQDATSSPAPDPVIEKRATCTQDSLLNALESPTNLANSYQFCRAYLSLPPASTATHTSTCILSSFAEVQTIIHPLYLYNLQPLTTTPTPLSYNSASATPSTIPGGAQYYDYPSGVPHREKRDAIPDAIPDAVPSAAPPIPQGLVRRATPTLPPYIATTYPASKLSSACSCLSAPATTTVSRGFFSVVTTTTCTNYVPTTVATYAAMCAPSLQVNAPVPNSHPGYRVVDSFPVPSKMDCCAACTSIFNCVWWKFDFGTKDNGWMPGTCHYAYYIGSAPASGDAPAICPNGLTQGIVKYSMGSIGLESNNNNPGYNFGPCGGAFNNFESNEDSGEPDDFESHICGQPGSQPVSSPPGCA